MLNLNESKENSMPKRYHNQLVKSSTTEEVKEVEENSDVDYEVNVIEEDSAKVAVESLELLVSSPTIPSIVEDSPVIQPPVTEEINMFTSGTIPSTETLQIANRANPVDVFIANEKLRAVVADFVANHETDTPVNIAKRHYSLYKVMRDILNFADQSEFNKEWGTLLQVVYNNRVKHFNEYKVYTEPGLWPGTETEYTNYSRLMFLVLDTCDISNRTNAFKTLNLERVMYSLNENQKNRLIGFYS